MKTLKMGMVGGGPGAMIGDIHRITATTSGRAKLVCGAFSTDPKKSTQKGKELGLQEHKIYKSFEEMIQTEADLPENERMDFLVITTPNHVHAQQAISALNAGFHVMCDKPLALSHKEAIEISKALDNSTSKFGMTYTYRGYPMLEKAMQLIKDQHLGEIKKVKVDYSQGWLSQPIEKDGHKQAAWRTDPQFSGAGGTIADIGTHAFNLLESVSNLKVKSLFADVSILVEGRRIDDDTNMLLEMENGAKGVLTASQISTGEDQDLTLKIYGSKAGFVWNHAHPNELLIKYPDFTEDKLTTHTLSDAENIALNIPGHSPYFLEAFQRLYETYFDVLLNKDQVNDFTKPTLHDGIRGMLFIEKAIQSSQEKKWIAL